MADDAAGFFLFSLVFSNILPLLIDLSLSSRDPCRLPYLLWYLFETLNIRSPLLDSTIYGGPSFLLSYLADRSSVV